MHFFLIIDECCSFCCCACREPHANWYARMHAHLMLLLLPPLLYTTYQCIHARASMWMCTIVRYCSSSCKCTCARAFEQVRVQRHARVCMRCSGQAGRAQAREKSWLVLPAGWGGNVQPGRWSLLCKLVLCSEREQGKQCTSRQQWTEDPQQQRAARLTCFMKGEAGDGGAALASLWVPYPQGAVLLPPNRGNGLAI